MYNDFYSVGAAQGWQCPICKRVLSPWTPECPCKGKVEWETSTSTPNPDSPFKYYGTTITMHGKENK